MGIGTKELVPFHKVDHLEITVEEGGGGTTVRFNLRPLSL